MLHIPTSNMASSSRIMIERPNNTDIYLKQQSHAIINEFNTMQWEGREKVKWDAKLGHKDFHILGKASSYFYEN